MVLDMAGFTPLRVPAWVNVPAGALNHTAVMRDRSALLLRSCSTTPLALPGRYLLTYPEAAAAARRLRLTYLPVV